MTRMRQKQINFFYFPLITELDVKPIESQMFGIDSKVNFTIKNTNYLKIKYQSIGKALFCALLLCY